MNGRLWSRSWKCWDVLATLPDWCFDSGSGLEPNWNWCNGFYPIKEPNQTEYAVSWLLAHFHHLRAWAPIKYLCCVRTTIWYIHKWCSFRCSSISYSPICDTIIVCWVISKIAQFCALFHSNSMNSDPIAHWTMGGGRASKTASFTYIWYCDTITTQMLNCSQSSEFGKMRHCCIINPAKKQRI